MPVAQWSERCAGVLCAGRRRKIRGGQIRGGSGATRRGSCYNDLAIVRSPPPREVIAAAFSFVVPTRMLALAPLRGVGERELICTDMCCGADADTCMPSCKQTGTVVARLGVEVIGVLSRPP